MEKIPFVFAFNCANNFYESHYELLFFPPTRTCLAFLTNLQLHALHAGESEIVSVFFIIIYRNCSHVNEAEKIEDACLNVGQKRLSI